MTQYHCPNCKRLFGEGKPKGKIQFQCKHCKAVSHFEAGEIVGSHIVQSEWPAVMPYYYRCEECERVLLATDGNVKMKTKCRYCGKSNTIQTAEKIEKDPGYNFSHKGALFGSKQIHTML